MNFYVEQIFENEYPLEAVFFCNNSQGSDNPLHIVEIESLNGVRRFKIVKNEKTEEIKKEDLKIKIIDLKKYLNETDWYVTRKLETGKEIPEDILNKRKEARDEISKLIEENEDLKQYL